MALRAGQMPPSIGGNGNAPEFGHRPGRAVEPFGLGGGPLDEVAQAHYATELLEAASGPEVEALLADLVKRLATGRIRRPEVRRALVAALRTLVGRALSAGRNRPPAAHALGLQLEGLSPEDRDFEAARHLVRFAGEAVRRVSTAPPTVPPESAVARAVTMSARQYAPGLLSQADGKEEQMSVYGYEAPYGETVAPAGAAMGEAEFGGIPAGNGHREMAPGEIPVAQEAPYGEMPMAQEVPFGEMPMAQEVPFGEMPMAQEAPYGEMPVAQEVPFGEMPMAQEAPYGEMPIGQEAPYGEMPYGEVIGEVGGVLEVPLSAAEETELASQLLEVTTEGDLEDFLGKLLKRVARGTGGLLRSQVGRALGGMLKNVAKATLPIAGGMVGSMLLPGAGTIVGRRLGTMASQLFEVPPGALESEAEQHEIARRYIRMASVAARNAALGSVRAHPTVLARNAMYFAARRHAPGVARRFRTFARPAPWYWPAPMPVTPTPAYGTAGLAGVGYAPRWTAPRGPAMSGRWVRRGRRIVLLGL